jgi:hypothetical protein
MSDLVDIKNIVSYFIPRFGNSDSKSNYTTEKEISSTDIEDDMVWVDVYEKKILTKDGKKRMDIVENLLDSTFDL